MLDCKDKDYSIGEVAKKLNLPVHTIRFWTEEFDHIKFFKKNGRRYYDNKAIEEFRKIKELSKKGMMLKGIKQTIRYHKIDAEKINDVKKNEFYKDIENCIKKIDKIVEVLNKI